MATFTQSLPVRCFGMTNAIHVATKCRLMASQSKKATLTTTSMKKYYSVGDQIAELPLHFLLRQTPTEVNGSLPE